VGFRKGFILSLLQNSNAISEGGYPISNSLRFQSASSQYLSRTPASAGNRKTFTYSFWLKRGNFGSDIKLIQVGSATNQTNFCFNSSNQLNLFNYIGAVVNGDLTSSAVFRDPAAWYHIVFSVDTTQATNTNRFKVYVNGILQALTGTYPTQNTDFFINNNQLHWIGQNGTGGGYLDGYMTDVYLIDGQALTPAAFGETDLLTGQWVAKKYTGTYGTNGFYLPFSNGTSTTTLGYDSSGNSNNWTLNNFTRSAGINDCWMLDVPSGNGSVISGTQPNSNYCVMNPLNKTSALSVNGGNLTVVSASGESTVVGTIGVSSGKWYWEMTAGTNGLQNMIGICKDGVNLNSFVGQNAFGWAYYGWNGKTYNNATQATYGSTYGVNDVIGIAFDADAGTLVFYKNNVSQGTAFSGLTNGIYYPAGGDADSGAQATSYWNFGQRSFAYTPPTGFKALCTANLPAATIKKGNQYMDATLYSGNSSTQTVVNAAGFKPDIVWMKARSINYNNLLHDSSRGVTKLLIPNGNDAEQTVTDGITSFNSNGFSLGANGSYNQSTRTYVGWQWKVNGGTTVSNTNGSITSNVQVNSTAGFSIVTYTGTGANATVGHGLGVAPKMIFVKKLSTIQAWSAWHIGLSGTEYLVLNTTAGKATLSSMWNSAIPTSSVINLGTDGNTNASSGTYVAYAFAEIAGFSKFGSYIGNGSADGSFVYTGFKPKYIMYKRIDTTGNWIVYDTTRSTYNQPAAALYPNLANAEDSSHPSDILSNGFKLRSTGADSNASGGTFIYMAFAENPFANSNAQ